MQLPIEIGLRPDLHVGRNPGSTKSTVSRTASPQVVRGFIGENDHQVVVAVRASITPGGGAEQVDAQWMIDLRQPTD